MTWISCKTKVPPDFVRVKVLCRDFMGQSERTADDLFETEASYVSQAPTGEPFWEIGAGAPFWATSEKLCVEYWRPL